MAYKHKYITGTEYSFYNNSDDLETDANFNYWQFKLVHSDTFIEVISDLGVLTKDIISGTDYRWYIEDFSIPDVVDIGCYRFIIEDSISGNVLYISEESEVVSNDDGLMFVQYRNAKNILNYNYEGLTDYNNRFHVEIFKRKPLNPETAEGYLLSDGTFKRVLTVLTKTFEFVTGWMDEDEHEATHSMVIHSAFFIAYDGQFNAMTKPEDSEYSVDWEENYEFIQGAVRLQENAGSSSNKAL